MKISIALLVILKTKEGWILGILKPFFMTTKIDDMREHKPSPEQWNLSYKYLG